MRKLLLAGGLAVILTAGFVLSGCLIDPPDSPNLAANILKLKPSNLEALPAGSIYEGWLVAGDTVDGAWVGQDRTEWKSFGRFNWDPYNYQPLDASGNIIENRFDAGVNVFDYQRIYITIEPTGAEETPVSTGIVLLQGNVDYMNEDADLQHPISTQEISDFFPENFYWIYSQSDGEWYDNETGTFGIWFGEIVKGDKVVFDSLCRNDDGDWVFCEDLEPPQDYPDTVFWCSFVDYIDTTFGDSIDFWIDENVDPPVTYIIYEDSTFDTTLFADECDPMSTTWDSLGFHDTIFLIVDGDTAMTPSLETMPPSVDGWEYEAWIIFKEGSGLNPLSMGRFTRPDAMDDNCKYCRVNGYDSNFTIPGEDFFEGVPEFGSLDVVRNELVDKLFVTVEPEPDFDPDNPYKQLIMFSARIPKYKVFFEFTIAGDDTTYTDQPRLGIRQFELVVRDLGFEINEGHRWPELHIDLEKEMVIE